MSEFLSHMDIKEESLAQREQLKGAIPTVVKIGGSVSNGKGSLLDNIAFLHTQVGVPLVIVHGGGPEIDNALAQKGIIPQKVSGLRVTDSDTLEVVVSTLDGVNHQLTTTLQEQGAKALGLTSQSGLLQAEIENPKLGFVGKVPSVHADDLKEYVAEGIMPVITPIAHMQNNEGQYLNINGDTAAGAIAATLGANLVLVTDVPGVMDQYGLVISHMTKDMYQQMVMQGSITSGMLPKIEAGFLAAQVGGKVAICQAKDLLRFFTEKPKGTYVYDKDVRAGQKMKAFEEINQQISAYKAEGRMLPQSLFEQHWILDYWLSVNCPGWKSSYVSRPKEEK